ncbi:hypothetical protein LBMAG53_21620 [Planctomycetota bacterium]|nr:hypothetical protein LBMAG53_21620 [Planctomycetota bacterium]
MIFQDGDQGTSFPSEAKVARMTGMVSELANRPHMPDQTVRQAADHGQATAGTTLDLIPVADWKRIAHGK